MNSWGTIRKPLLATLTSIACALTASNARADDASVVIEKQGSFYIGGTMSTVPGGSRLWGDAAYVQYQIPRSTSKCSRAKPAIIMWHGGGQSAKTWEETPDGRDGFQTIFLKRGFPVYMIDQPRRARAAQSLVGITIPNATPGTGNFGFFRMGTWPTGGAPQFFPGVQFSSDPAALDQWLMQQVPNTGPQDLVGISVDAVVALANKIGPSIVMTHSMSGQSGWFTAMRTPNVKGIIAIEPGPSAAGMVYPQGELPPVILRSDGVPNVPGAQVPLADFEKLTRIPILITIGDYIPQTPTPVIDLDRWRVLAGMYEQFRDAVNRHNGHLDYVRLPDRGIFGNTHFQMSDLNNVAIANLMSQWMQQTGLDTCPSGPPPGKGP
jgi:pimeloyl-ACP methyl ester carboxylesterase